MQEQPQRQNGQIATQGQTQTQTQATDMPELPMNTKQGEGDQLPTLAEWNNKYIDFVLNHTKGKKTAAARILGINRRTLYRRNISKSDNDSEMIDNDSTH